MENQPSTKAIMLEELPVCILYFVKLLLWAFILSVFFAFYELWSVVNLLYVPTSPKHEYVLSLFNLKMEFFIPLIFISIFLLSPLFMFISNKYSLLIKWLHHEITCRTDTSAE